MGSWLHRCSGRLSGVVILLILCLFTSSGNALALTISADLEQQVLEIIRNHPEVLIETLQRYQELQVQQRQALLLDRLFRDRQSIVADSPVQGNPESDLILLELSDFQCPFCAASQPLLKTVLANHPEVSLVYKHFPLTSIHPQALAAARSSWAAHQQGKFWAYHDALFANADRLSEAVYLEIAESIGLNSQQFENDRQSEAALIAIQNDVRLGQELGIQGTPLFVLYNLKTRQGEYLYGVRTANDFEAALLRIGSI